MWRQARGVRQPVAAARHLVLSRLRLAEAWSSLRTLHIRSIVAVSCVNGRAATLETALRGLRGRLAPLLFAQCLLTYLLYRLPQQPQETRSAGDDVRPPTAALLQHTQRASRRPRAAALFGNLMTVISIAFIVGTRPLPTDP